MKLVWELNYDGSVSLPPDKSSHFPARRNRVYKMGEAATQIENSRHSTMEAQQGRIVTEKPRK
ncbi:hypothetical protein RchiOBHm_Chr4g0405671 [Rosa chinensis]|uniref:Uncharacterized protein n=1 Tax=Rosa chinensis TaxID=74649 RepID=A0A2P6QU89_ROSCH|nr:hypothetical protein RchiOBHm_Chr4g0405671 [Rosa chinensis]